MPRIQVVRDRTQILDTITDEILLLISNEITEIFNYNDKQVRISVTEPSMFDHNPGVLRIDIEISGRKYTPEKAGLLRDRLVEKLKSLLDEELLGHSNVSVLVKRFEGEVGVI